MLSDYEKIIEVYGINFLKAYTSFLDKIANILDNVNLVSEELIKLEVQYKTALSKPCSKLLHDVKYIFNLSDDQNFPYLTTKLPILQQLITLAKKVQKLFSIVLWQWDMLKNLFSDWAYNTFINSIV